MNDFKARGGLWVAAQFPLLLLHGALCVFTRATPLVAAVSIAGAVLAVGGLVVAAAAMRQLGEALTALPMPNGRGRLVQGGLYARVRHPIYSGVLLLCAGWAMAWQSLPGIAGVLVLIVFFAAKARREEALLANHFDGYAGYRARTRMLIPWVI